MREERLEDAEALRCDRAGGLSLGSGLTSLDAPLARGLGRGAGVASRSVRSASATSSRSSDGSSGIARPFCRRIHETSGPRLE